MKKESVLKFVTYLIAVIFVIVHIYQRNYEFIGHIVIALILFWITLFFYKKYEFPFIGLVGFVVWMTFHLLGGTDINGIRVYSMILLDISGSPLYFLRYDQLMHFYCYLVVGYIIYYIMKKELKNINFSTLIFMIIMSIGVGALNEIVEFSMVMLLPNTGVGDYFNNAFDLVMNAAGSIVGVLWAYYNNKK